MKAFKILPVLLAVGVIASCEKKNEPEPVVSSITLSSDKTLNVESSGNVYAVEFETAENWIATPSSTWIVPDVKAGEAGKATISLTVAVNKDYDSREGFLAIASGIAKDTVFVKQGEAHALIVGKARFDVEAAGGNVEIEVSANLKYSVAVDKDAAGWLSINENATKALEKSTVTVLVAENEDVEGREGKIIISADGIAETVVVSQAAGESVLEISETSFELPAAGGSVSFTVETNLGYEVVIDDAAKEWLVINADTKAITSSTVSLSIAENTSLEARTAEVKIVTDDSKSGVVTISQKWREPVFEITGGDQRIPAVGGSFAIGVKSEIEIIVNKPDWLAYEIDAEGNYVFTAATNNTDGMREGKIVLYNLDYTKTKAFSVSQKSTKSIYILAIGNSFSWDAMEYLQPILYEMGYRDIFLGNLYIGGCSLETHANNITSGASAYDYRVCTTGTWSSSKSSSVTALKSRDWDYVSVQQVSGLSGVAETYEPYLTTVMDKVMELSPDSRKMWHMTWAYQSNSTHSDFSRYGSNQQTMYQAIVSATQEKVVSRGDFDFVIPSGTAVQNLRSSFIGDVITRDGYHMSYDNGRLLTALMWARQITGKSVADISYTPSGYSFSDKQKAAIKESVENAFQKPFEPTQSEYKDESKVKIEPTDELKAIFTGAGYSLDDYTALPIELTHNAYYNSTGNSTMQSEANSSATNLSQFAATQIFSKSQICNGSVLVLKSGYQYRPEAWTALTAKNASADRPANVTTQIVVVNDAWWGSFNYRAFNLAKAGNPSLTAEQQKELEGCFAIFVPNAQQGTESSTDAILTANGYNPSNYTKLVFSYTKGAFYNSTSNKDLLTTGASNSSQFVATDIVPKSAIPAGSLIVVKTGFQYRPEGWQSLGANNTSSRPGTVTTRIVTVDSAWWGNFNYRAFNLAKEGNPSLIDAEMDEVIDSFAVYVPL